MFLEGTQAYLRASRRRPFSAETKIVAARRGHGMPLRRSTFALSFTDNLDWVNASALPDIFSYARSPGHRWHVMAQNQAKGGLAPTPHDNRFGAALR